MTTPFTPPCSNRMIGGLVVGLILVLVVLTILVLRAERPAASPKIESLPAPRQPDAPLPGRPMVPLPAEPLEDLPPLVAAPLNGDGPEYPPPGVQLPVVHTPDGQIFAPAMCAACNRFGFVTNLGGELVGNTPQPVATYGWDIGGKYTQFAWYFQPGVRVMKAGFEANVGNGRVAADSVIVPAPAGNPYGAATMAWFRIYPDDEALADAWFAAVAP